MPSYLTPKKNTAFVFGIGLADQANTKLLKVNPTIAAGDFQVSIDGGAFANLASLPTVTPAGGRRVQISLSAAEMNGDNITVQCVDAAGAEWCDAIYTISTTARQVDDLAFPATSGRSLAVDASGRVDIGNWNGTAIDFTHLGIIAQGTAGAFSNGTGGVAGSASLVLTGQNFGADNAIVGALLLIRSATTGALQLAPITGWVNSTATASFDPFTVALTGTITYVLLAGPKAGITLPDVNVKTVAGTTQTARDLGASVLISSGTGAGQLDVTSGVIKANLVQILATALTETAGQIAAAFRTFFNVASPTLTAASVNQTGDSFARLGAPAGASVSADIAALPKQPLGVRKNTALAAFEFPMVSSADHVTPATGLTVTARRSLDGAAFASCANAVTELSNGFYKIDLAAADLNGDVVTLLFTATGADNRSVTIRTTA